MVDTNMAEPTRTVEAVVCVLIPEFDQAKAQDSEGHVYTLTRKTPGVELAALQLGQRVLCTVTCKLPRVIVARPLA